MNFCIIYGKIVSEIKFDFFYKSKLNSISRFYVELSNKSIIEIKAYDNLADFTYSKLKNTDNVIINGRLTKNCIIAEGIANWD